MIFIFPKKNIVLYSFSQKCPKTQEQQSHKRNQSEDVSKSLPPKKRMKISNKDDLNAFIESTVFKSTSTRESIETVCKQASASLWWADGEGLDDIAEKFLCRQNLIYHPLDDDCDQILGFQCPASIRFASTIETKTKTTKTKTDDDDELRIVGILTILYSNCKYPSNLSISGCTLMNALICPTGVFANFVYEMIAKATDEYKRYYISDADMVDELCGCALRGEVDGVIRWINVVGMRHLNEKKHLWIEEHENILWSKLINQQCYDSWIGMLRSNRNEHPHGIQMLSAFISNRTHIISILAPYFPWVQFPSIPIVDAIL